MAKVLYRHFKGGVYEYLGGFVHSETGEQVVAYRGEDGRQWVRPLDSFFDTVEVDGMPMFRFAPVCRLYNRGAQP